MSDREQEYLEKVRLRPTDTLARYVLAKDYFDQGDHPHAIEQFRVLVSQKPDWMKCWIHLGQSLVATDDRAGAREVLERALALAQAQHHEGPAADIEELLGTLA